MNLGHLSESELGYVFYFYHCVELVVQVMRDFFGADAQIWCFAHVSTLYVLDTVFKNNRIVHSYPVSSLFSCLRLSKLESQVGALIPKHILLRILQPLASLPDKLLVLNEAMNIFIWASCRANAFQSARKSSPFCGDEVEDGPGLGFDLTGWLCCIRLLFKVCFPALYS